MLAGFSVCRIERLQSTFSLGIVLCLLRSHVSEADDSLHGAPVLEGNGGMPMEEAIILIRTLANAVSKHRMANTNKHGKIRILEIRIEIKAF